MKTTNEMSHTRPFRWRRKHQGEPVEKSPEDEHHHHPQHQQQQEHLTLRSSAIGPHQVSSLSEQHTASGMIVCRPQTSSIGLLSPATTTHSQRYSPTSAPTRTPTRTTRRRRHSPTCPKLAFSLPTLMSLSIFACVILSLLNLSIDQMQPRMVVAIGATGTGPASVSSLLASGATQVSGQSGAPSQQQQQSNSVIQYPATAPAATTSTKAKYKTMYACEDRQLTMDCETGSKINLIRANFGRFSITQCNEQGQLDLSTDCMSPITFRIMQERCQDRQRCSVNATSALFGDRCPKTRKYLEVHFQCQMMEPDIVDVRLPSRVISQNQVQTMPVHGPIISAPKPPNNPTSFPGARPQLSILNSNNNYQPFTEDTQVHQSISQSSTATPIDTNNNQFPAAVINSQIMTSVMALNNVNSNQFDVTNKLPDLDTNRELYILSMRHSQIENMSKPRCYQWDTNSRQWTDKGTRILETNQTHTLCAFDQQTSYVLVMDYSGPIQPISQNKQAAIQQPSTSMNGSPMPDLLENQPIPIDNYIQTSSYNPPSSSDEGNKMIHPPTTDSQQNQQQQQQTSPVRSFVYLLGIISLVMGLAIMAFGALSIRSSGASFKSLGNFTPFSGPKYKQRRHTGDPPSLHSNKDLLVINNSNGHSFIYAPASTTKISSSSSTHILSTGQPNSQHQAGTLHRLQQQQMYSGNGATLSSLSGTGAQSNNYYYGLMGLNPILQQQQQQQQQHHFSQHHLDQPQSQQAQLVGHQPQTVNTTSYNRQANKSSVSNESANSSASSSGVESGSTSMQQQQQQQQARTQQACLVSAMNNNDFHLMGHHISNYGQHQPQQHNLFATLKGASVTHQPHQHQPTFTVNAHYSTSGGVNGGLQSINMSQNQASAMMLHNRQASNQMRDHIYECVDDDKPYMARLLMPTQSNSQHQIFGSPTFMSTRRIPPSESGARQK